LKKEIGRRLSPRSWPEIDLVLEEFGGNTSSMWNGGQFSYVVAMLFGRKQAFNGNGKTAAEISRELFDAYLSARLIHPNGREWLRAPESAVDSSC
jgi:hypothetical protein